MAEPDDLDRAARYAEQKARELRDTATGYRVRAASVAWEGDAASAFREDVIQRCGELNRSADDLDRMAADLRRGAEQIREERRRQERERQAQQRQQQQRLRGR